MVGGFMPWYSGSGGGQIIAYKLSEAISRKGHRVDYLTIAPGDFKREIEWGNFIYSTPDFQNLFKCYKNIKAEKYDIVHLHIPREALWHSLSLVLQKSFNKNVKLVVGIYAPHLKPVRFPHSITELCRIYACKNADIVFCLSNFSKSIITNGLYDIPPSKIKVTYSGVDESFLSIKEKNFNKDHFELLFCGRLGKRKGVDTLLRAMPIILKKHDVKLTVIGGGPISKYRYLAGKLGMGKYLTFTGFVKYSELPEYYARADMFVFPSKSESFGLVLAEAMASYSPVVSTKAGAIPEVIKDGETGVLVNPGDPVALGNAINSLLDNPKKNEVNGKER